MAIISFDKTTLTKLYIDEKLSINKIADRYSLNPETIRRQLHRNGIKLRPRGGRRTVFIDKETLSHQYFILKKPLIEIARSFGCGETAIWNLTQKYGIKVRERSELLRGRKFSISHRINLSKSKIGKNVGEKNPNWKGGITISNTRIRFLKEYATFRRNILRLRGDKCEMCRISLLDSCRTCGHRPNRHVHHIKPFSSNPDLRFDISNVIVICQKCHKTIHK